LLFFVHFFFFCFFCVSFLFPSNLEISNRLIHDYEWSREECKKIWSFEYSRDGGINMLLDSTRGCQYVQDIQDSLCTAFTQLCNNGPLTGKHRSRNIRSLFVFLHDIILNLFLYIYFF
jgi:hypothetical protein